MESLFNYRISFLGCPSEADVAWTGVNLQKMIDLGFNTMQLNIAWGARPGDEPLNLEEMAAWRQRALAYALHLRETNLTGIIRRQIAAGAAPAAAVVAELREVLARDVENRNDTEPCRAALACLDDDPAVFAERYFAVPDTNPVAKGYFSVTTR